MQCNRCHLKSIRKRARADGKSVTVLADASRGMGGWNVYVHPRDVAISLIPHGEDGERARYRVAWLMEIPEGCEC